jgi:hypothetical protein
MHSLTPGLANTLLSLQGKGTGGQLDLFDRENKRIRLFKTFTSKKRSTMGGQPGCTRQEHSQCVEQYHYTG